MPLWLARLCLAARRVSLAWRALALEIRSAARPADRRGHKTRYLLRRRAAAGVLVVPAARSPAPSVRVLLPMTGDIGRRGGRPLYVLALLPDILRSVPRPMSRLPDVSWCWCWRRGLDLRRRRCCRGDYDRCTGCRDDSGDRRRRQRLGQYNRGGFGVSGAGSPRRRGMSHNWQADRERSKTGHEEFGFHSGFSIVPGALSHPPRSSTCSLREYSLRDARNRLVPGQAPPRPKT